MELNKEIFKGGVAPAGHRNKERVLLFYKFLSRYSSANTVRSYKSNLKKLFEIYQEVVGSPLIDERSVSDIHASMIINHLKTKDLSPKSINLFMVACSEFYRFMQEERLIEKNPFERIRRFKISKEVVTRSIPHEKYELIFPYCKELIASNNFQEGLVLFLFFTTGRRHIEICSLKGRDILVKNGIVYVDWKVKGGKNIIRPLRKDLSLLILKYIDLYKIKKDSYLFFTKDENVKISRNKVDRMFKKMARTLDLDEDIHPHVARAAVITYLSRKGVQIQKVSKFVNHANIEMTELYNKNMILDEEYIMIQDLIN